MKKINRIIAIIFAITLAIQLQAPLVAYAGEVNLEKPSLTINEKGKVDVVDGDGNKSDKDSLVTQAIDKYRYWIAGVSGIGAVSMILFFILNFMRLGGMGSAERPEERNRAMIGLAVSGVAAAGLGAVAFITGIFFNALS